MLVKMHRMKLGIPHIIYMMVTMSTVPTLLRYGHDNMVSVLIIPMSNKKGLTFNIQFNFYLNPGYYLLTF